LLLAETEPRTEAAPLGTGHAIIHYAICHLKPIWDLGLRTCPCLRPVSITNHQKARGCKSKALWISGPVVEGAPTDTPHGGAEARRKQREETTTGHKQGQLAQLACPETGTDRQRSDYVAAPLSLNELSVGPTERSLSPTHDTHVALGLGTPTHPLAANCHSDLQH
jgi:hypothetical protein